MAHRERTSRLSRPEQAYEAKRAAILRRLVMDEWFDELDAEDGVAGWERRAEELGHDRMSIGYWDQGWRWIIATHPENALATP